MTAFFLIQSLCILAVLVLWASWGAMMWSQRKRVLRLWAVSIVGGVLWTPTSMHLMKTAYDAAGHPPHGCGTGQLMFTLTPLMFGLPLMAFVLVVLTAATLIRRHRAKTHSM